MRLRVQCKLYFDRCKITARGDSFLSVIEQEIDFFLKICIVSLSVNFDAENSKCKHYQNMQR